MARSDYFSGMRYQRMSDDLHLAGFSQRTHDGYLRAVRQLADYVQLTPDQITEQQLRKYFLHLKNERLFATGSMRVAFSGIKFFYTRTCRRDWQTLATMKIQNVKSLPEVLTIPQVHQIIEACRLQRLAVYFWTVYSMGLRLEEGLHLQVGDVDAERGMVHVHRGKGAKDRYVPLPTTTLHCLPQNVRSACAPPSVGLANADDSSGYRSTWTAAIRPTPTDHSRQLTPRRTQRP